MKGVVNYKVTDKYGNIKLDRTIENQIQNAGKVAVASLIASDNPQSEDTFDAMAIGTGDGQAVTATGLSSEITTNGGGRRSGANVTATSQTENVTNDTIQFVTTWSFTGTLAIKEAGIFNHSSASTGTMLAYQDFAVINVNDGDNLQVTWKITFS